MYVGSWQTRVTGPAADQDLLPMSAKCPEIPGVSADLHGCGRQNILTICQVLLLTSANMLVGNRS